MTFEVESRVKNNPVVIDEHFTNCLSPSQPESTLSREEAERSSTLKTYSERTGNIDELIMEIVNIRNKALNMLIKTHGLKLDQIMALKLSDLNLEEKILFMESKHRSNPQFIRLTEDTVRSISSYIRVRLPSKEKELFVSEKNLERKK